MTEIHPTAVVHPSAQLAPDVAVGPYTIIEADVQVGAGSTVGAHVTLGERLILGQSVRIFNYACLGTASQDSKHRGEVSHARIGDRSIVREFVTVNRATRQGGVTSVGADVILMAYCHVAHECQVGDGAILVNGVTLGGEVIIEPGAILSGLACVHQYCRVGSGAIVGANSKVTLDIPPYAIADGHRAQLYGPNVIGLRRKGYSGDQIAMIRRIYRELFAAGRKLSESLDSIERKFGAEPIASSIIQFCRSSKRGIARPRRRTSNADAARRIQQQLEAASIKT